MLLSGLAALFFGFFIPQNNAMKYLLLIMAVCSCLQPAAQDIAAFGKAGTNTVLLYHLPEGNQTALENTKAVRRTKTTLGGFGGSSFSYILEGEKSPVRLRADSAIFVTDKGKGLLATDPSITITLYKLEAGNDKRIAVLNKYKPSYVGGGSKNTNTKIPMGTKDLKEGLQQLLPEKKLEPGEYAFITITIAGNNYDGKNTKYIVFAFGID